MTPRHQRMLFAAFGVVVICGAINMVFLQPAQQAGRSSADTAAARAEAERRQRLALDKAPQQVPQQTQQQTALAADAEAKPARAVKHDDGRAPQALTPPRAASVATGPVSLSPSDQGLRPQRVMKPNSATTEVTVDTLPEAPDAEGDPDTIKAVQRELTERGYGPLIVDGVPGPVTRAAIMAFEHDTHLALTGEATERLLARLLLGASGAQASEGAAGRVRSPQAEIILRTVQQSLVALGYSISRIDGRPGEETERAIRDFEYDEGLEPKGRVSAEVFGRVARAVAAQRPQMPR